MVSDILVVALHSCTPGEVLNDELVSLGWDFFIGFFCEVQPDHTLCYSMFGCYILQGPTLISLW